MSEIAVIGDIHGMHDKFIELLDKLPKDIEQIYTVGDLIDRGPDSKKVVQECIDRGIICVKGNHEDMFLDALRNERKYDPGIFLMNGGYETLQSYGLEIKHGSLASVPMPDDHLEFIINMPYYIETDDFILSHAGVASHIEKTFKDCSTRSQQELMWDRTSKARDLSKFQVYGHTPVKEVEFLKKWNMLDEKHDIVGVNIDTCAFVTGHLSAVIIPSLEIIQT